MTNLSKGQTPREVPALQTKERDTDSQPAITERLDMSDRVALITGAGSGFGAATAEMMAGAGANIVAVDRKEERGRQLVQELSSQSDGEHHLVARDVRSAEAAQAVVPEAMEQTEGRLDVVVNSAGVSYFTEIDEISPEEWDEVMEVDVRSLFFISVAAAEAMDPERGGRIINLGSNAGRKGRTLSAHYSAAKAAVTNVTQSLAMAYGQKNITVNTVSPGPILTPMWDGLFANLKDITGKSPDELAEGWRTTTPMKKLGTPADVANLIVFLASDQAGFISGQNINVAGGFMLTC